MIRKTTDRGRIKQKLLESNRRLEEAQSIAQIGSWTWDLSADHVNWTPGVYRIFGVDPTRFVPSREAVGRRIHPEDQERYQKQVEVWLTGIDPEPLDFRILLSDGSERTISSRAKTECDGTGRVTQLVGTVQDVTERRRIERALQASEQRFRTLIEHSADAIALVAPEGIITYASPGNTQVLGYAPDQMLGVSLFEFIAPDSRAAVSKLLSSSLCSPGVAVAFYAEGLRPDRTRSRLEGHLSNLLDVPGVAAVVCNYRDVTDREHQREALEQAHREADIFRRMVDLATQAIGTADLDARVLYQNPALLRLLGLPSLDAARGYAYEDFYREEDLERLRREVIPTVLAEGRWTGEMTLKPLGREPVSTIHSISLLRDDAGRPTAFSNVVTDISAQKAIERALRASEAKYRQLFELARDGIAVADPKTGELLDCNPALCRMVERSRKELIGQPQRILHPREPHSKGVTKSFELHRSGRHSEVRDERIITSTGEVRYVEIKANFVDLGGRQAMQGVFHDITDRRRAEEALIEEKERAQVTLHSIGDAVIVTDAAGRVNYLNPVAEKLTAWSLDEAYGHALDEIFQTYDEGTGEPADNPVARCLQEGELVHTSRPKVLTGRDGTAYDIDESAAPIRQPNGNILGAVLVFHDVSETRQLTRKMAYDAAHDPLTGLINRREFEIRVGQALESAQHYGARHALCYIDLDQFKIVNDTAGHTAGDELLKQIKGVLEGTFRDRDSLARLGGDEFGLLLDNCPLERAESIAGRVVDVIREHRFVWSGKGFQVGASIGLAPITDDSESVARLLSQADVACYTAKDLGRNQVHVYHAKGGVPLQRHSEILQAAGLRDALEQNRFRLYRQPIVPLIDTDEQAPFRYELLLRLLDSDDNLVLPGAFIPAAERFGLMGELDRWVIRTAFQTFGAAQERRPTQIAVNLSGNSLNDESLLDYVSAQFDASSLAPEKVCFEITETAAVHDLSRASRFMYEVKRLGCQLALDDFGSGLSSLRYLKTLPVDYLKIDGSFVHTIEVDSGDHAIVAAVNQLAHSLDIRTIAEYASNRLVVERLRSLGVDYAQGDALGRPTPCPTTGIGA